MLIINGVEFIRFNSGYSNLGGIENKLLLIETVEIIPNFNRMKRFFTICLHSFLQKKPYHYLSNEAQINNTYYNLIRHDRNRDFQELDIIVSSV